MEIINELLYALFMCSGFKNWWVFYKHLILDTFQMLDSHIGLLAITLTAQPYILSFLQSLGEELYL